MYRVVPIKDPKTGKQTLAEDLITRELYPVWGVREEATGQWYLITELPYQTAKAIADDLNKGLKTDGSIFP